MVGPCSGAPPLIDQNPEFGKVRRPGSIEMRRLVAPPGRQAVTLISTECCYRFIPWSCQGSLIMTHLTALPYSLVSRGSRRGAAHHKRATTPRVVKGTRPAVARCRAPSNGSLSATLGIISRTLGIILPYQQSPPTREGWRRSESASWQNPNRLIYTTKADPGSLESPSAIHQPGESALSLRCRIDSRN